MPSSLSKRSGKKRSVRKSSLAAVPVEDSALCSLVGVNCPPEEKTRSGLALGSLIMMLVAAASVSLAALAYQKMNFATSYAAETQSRLAASEARGNDLAEQVKNLQTLNELQSKVNDVVWKEYSSPNLSLDYPDSFEIVKATSAFPALTVKNGNDGKIEIFRADDFKGGVRTEYDNVFMTKVGMPGNDKIVPYDVWVYYGNSDATTKAVLDKIVASIKINK